MNPAIVEHFITDQDRNALYRILAYRRLTAAEMFMAASMYAERNQGMARNRMVTIYTLYGSRPGW